jgi:hypothetical protein
VIGVERRGGENSGNKCYDISSANFGSIQWIDYSEQPRRTTLSLSSLAAASSSPWAHWLATALSLCRPCMVGK